MAEHFSLEVMGPIITPEMRAVREDQLAERQELQGPVIECAFPGCKGIPYRRRMPTCYVDDESNFLVACKEHHEESDKLWEDQWAEYHSGLLVGLTYSR